MHNKKWILAAGLVLGLAACGDSVGEQALFGGGAGALGGAAIGGDPVTGAAVGAAGNIAYCQTYPQRC